MKYICSIAAVVAMALGSSAFAEDGNVSQAQLNELGLGGISVMSDSEGSEVRGRFAFASSVSASGVPGAFNVSPAVGIGINSATASSGSSSSINASGVVGGVFGGTGGFGGFLAFFNLNATVSSSGFAIATAN